MPSAPCASSSGNLTGSVIGGLGVDHRVEREFRQPGLDVSWRGGPVARQYVAPVALSVYKQVFLSELHQGVAYRRVAVGVELHGVAHDVGHLVVAPVVHSFHRVQYAPLHGLQAVLDVGDGALQYNVRGIVEKPVLVHAAQVVHRRGVKPVYGFVVGVLCGLSVGFVLVVGVVGVVAGRRLGVGLVACVVSAVGVGFFEGVVVFYFVAHKLLLSQICLKVTYFF